MTDPVDAAGDDRPSVGIPAGRETAPSLVAWDDVPPSGKGPRRALDAAVSVVALAALVFLALVRAGVEPDLGSAERFGYVLGAVVFALLISLGWRWLWLRFQRRSARADLLSPWIPIGGVILIVLSILGGN